jgi:hypothetical protein
MPEEFVDGDTARHSAPLEYDKARHSLTIFQAVELFAHLSVPRSKRSVQRFCEQGHLDCVRIKGARGDQFFINRESVHRYAEELRQIDAVASFASEERHDAPQHVAARNSALERDTVPEPVAVASAPTIEPERRERTEIIAQLSDENAKLRDENLNLRIDNRGKEQAINFITAQAREKEQHLHEISYRLGVAESRVAQLEAPKAHDDAPRQRVQEHGAEPVDAVVIPESPVQPAPEPEPQPKPIEPRRSIFGRLFGQGRG